MKTTASGSVGPAVVAINGDAHWRHAHVHGSVGHSSEATPSGGAVGVESLANCCRSDGFHCGGTQAVSSAASVVPYFPLAQSTLTALRESVYVGPTLARLIRPPIV